MHRPVDDNHPSSSVWHRNGTGAIIPATEIRVGRHHDKLQIIRDSLRPFEQTSPSDTLSSEGSGGTATTSIATAAYTVGDGCRSHQETMLNTLTQIGFDQEAAFYALKLVKFASVASAAEVLLNISRHDFNIFQPSNNKVSTTNGNCKNGIFVENNDSSSSRSDSPLTRIPSPSNVVSTSGLRTSSPMASVRPSIPHYSSSAFHYVSSCSHSNAIKQSHAHVTLQPPISCSTSEAHTSLMQTAVSRKVRMPRPQSAHSPTVITIYPTQQQQQQQQPSTSVLRARLDPYSGLTVRIAVDSQQTTDGQRLNNFHLESDTRQMTMQGGHVQSIVVDPDRQPTYVNYVDQLCQRTLSVLNGPERSFGQIMSTTGRTSPSSASWSTASSADSVNGGCRDDGPVRSVSPLPDSITTRLEKNDYESATKTGAIKPCKAPMFCFFMEQHVERLILQYRERADRLWQLSKEMQSANLNETMCQRMKDYLEQKESRHTRLRRQKMSKDMFEKLRVIGKGAFGEVALVRKKDTEALFAMKTLLKKDVIAKQQTAHVKAERDILAEANSVWIVKLFYSFQDKISLFLIMEFIPGGDMMTLLIKKEIFDESLARFYIAELTCAIEYVHRLGFIHRDIKPDNILIDQNGHIKLTDFGLCTGLRWTHDRKYYGPDDRSTTSHLKEDSLDLGKRTDEQGHPIKVLHCRNNKKRNKAHSVVGTCNYMSPEVILKTGHTQLCDWCEMVIGRPPFHSDDQHKTQQKIVHWNEHLLFPSSNQIRLSSLVIDLISKLCCDQEIRLGHLNGARDLKAHYWFENTNFDRLRETPAPYRPEILHAADTSNFDPFFEPIDDSRPSAIWDTMQRQGNINPAFYEFTFRHFFDMDAHGCPTLKTNKRPSLAPLFESTVSCNTSPTTHIPSSSSSSTTRLRMHSGDHDCSDESLVV